MNELDKEKLLYKDRFEVITFNESELEEAKYLSENNSKGASEIFAINYAFHNSKLIKYANFIIKVTARFYIPDLEDFLSKHDLDTYDCLTQHNRDRCEMVGSHLNNFFHIFNIKIDHFHIEHVWKKRASQFKNILICDKFEIEKTQRGGLNEFFYDIYCITVKEI